MTTETWLGIVLTCLAGAASPGMSLAMIIKHTLANGRRAGFIASWSHALGIGIYAIAAVFGLSVIFERQPWLFSVLLMLGGLYLAKVGLQSVLAFHQAMTSNQTEYIAAEKNDSEHSGAIISAAREGFSMAILNPKTLLFFGAIFTVFISNQNTVEKLSMAAIPLLVDGLYYTFITVIMGVSLIQKPFNRYQHWLNGLFGLIFLGYSIYLILASLKSLAH